MENSNNVIRRRQSRVDDPKKPSVSPSANLLTFQTTASFHDLKQQRTTRARIRHKGRDLKIEQISPIRDFIRRKNHFRNRTINSASLICFKTSRLQIPKDPVIRKSSFIIHPVDRGHIHKQMFHAGLRDKFDRLGREERRRILSVVPRSFSRIIRHRPNN